MHSTTWSHSRQPTTRPELFTLRQLLKVFESADTLAGPLQNTTEYISAIYNSPSSTRWDVFTFATDSSLTTGPGWDNATGVGTSYALPLIEQVLGLVTP